MHLEYEDQTAKAEITSVQIGEYNTTACFSVHNCQLCVGREHPGPCEPRAAVEAWGATLVFNEQ